MENRVVLITGGASGIGRSIGKFLVSKGFKVYGTTRNLERNSHFTEFELLEMDVRYEAAVQKAVGEVLFRESRLDILINNAGMGITGPIEETPREEIINAFDTNFLGPVLMAKAVLPMMRSQKSGLIINITSIAGYMGLPYRGIYSATKGALGLITEALRMETRDFGIYITNLAPGDFATNIAAGRYHSPIHSGSPYSEAYENTLSIMNSHVATGQDPVRVAEMVFRIIRAKRPKIHYTVGSQLQKWSLVLKKILPDKLFERLLLHHYKL